MSAKFSSLKRASPQTSPLSLFLLYGFAIALIACIAGAGILYLYSIAMQRVSDLRRNMNIAAYDAQVYFDSREVALQYVANSLFKHSLHDSPPASSQDTSQLHYLTLGSPEDGSVWLLPLTAREKNSLRQLQAQLLYTSLSSGETHYLPIFPESLQEQLPLSPAQQRWIAQYLASISTNTIIEDSPPILMLRLPDDNQPRLFLYTPLNSQGSTHHNWIGMEINTSSIFTQVPSQNIRYPNYLLLNNDLLIVLKNGVYQTPEKIPPELLSSTHGDLFDMYWKDALPHLVLSKTMGKSGWRIIYWIPLIEMLNQGLLPILPTTVLVLLLCTVVCFALYLIHSRLIQPASQHYVTMQEDERLKRLIIASSPVGLCILNRHSGQVLYSNNLAETWLAQEDPTWLQEALQQSGLGIERSLHNGQYVSIDLVPTTYHGQEMQLCAIKDITPLKQVEYSLLAAKQKAISANRAKSEFLATMSHEIRTPLFGIMGTLELLSLTNLTSQQTQYFHTIQHSATTLLRTLNETLDVSRMESGSETLQNIPLSPQIILNNVVASYADRAQKKGILLYSIVDSKTPDFVIGDELRIRQILNNLVSNAIKFTLGGHIVLRLYVHHSAQGMVTLNFQVSDTGIGINEEDQKLLFSAYHQATDNASQQTDGSGLGLFICQRLAALMQGTLSLCSEPGLGSSISLHVELPVHTPPLPSKTQRSLKPERIFVRGDIPEVVQNICEWLNRWGMIATPFHQSAKPLPPQAILVDTWPLNTEPEPIHWLGKRIVLLPPGKIPEQQDNALLWYSNAYDLSSLYDTLHRAQNKIAPTQQTLITHNSSSLLPLDMHVLVVDDNAINRHILEEQLQHLGCRATHAADGIEALRLLQHLTVDAVLTDINMPNMNGYALSQTLRQQGFQKPIFGITAAIVNDQQQLAREAGMNDLLSRPLSLSAFYDALLSITFPQADS